MDKSLSLDSYRPGFYILPRTESDGLHLFQILSREEEIYQLTWKINIQTFLTVIKQENLSTYSYNR